METMLWITNFEAPYRVPFYNLIAERYKLTMVLSETPSDQTNRNQQWFSGIQRNYEVVQLKARDIAGIRICFDIKKLVKEKYDFVFMDMYGNATNIYAIFLLNWLKKEFYMSVDGMLPKKSEFLPVKLLKSYLLKSPKRLLSPSEYVDRILQSYGVDKNVLSRYHITSQTMEDVQLGRIKKEKKVQVKGKPDRRKTILSVGRFTYDRGYGKGYDVLLRLAKSLRDIDFWIVGDKPTEEFLQIKRAERLNNVTFAGFKKKQELMKYYESADLFMLLTRGDVWGFVINEAMSFGLPIITTDKCIAGIELVKNGQNGYVLSLDNFENIKKKTKQLLEDDEQLKLYGENSLSIIKDYTIEKMALDHFEVLKE